MMECLLCNWLYRDGMDLSGDGDTGLGCSGDTFGIRCLQWEYSNPRRCIPFKSRKHAGYRVWSTENTLILRLT